MKKLLSYTLFIIGLFTCVIISAKADSCTYKEQQALSKQAKNIKVSYEIKEQKLPEGYYFTETGISDPNGNDVSKEYANYFIGKYAEILVTNLNDDLYFKIDDSELISSSGKDQFSIDDAVDGVITLTLKDLNQVKNLKLAMYSKDSFCKNQIYTKYVKIPRYNSLHATGMCSDIKDYDYCQEFIYTNASEITLRDRIYKYKQSLAQDKKNEKKNYSKIIITASIIGGLLLIGLILFFLIKNRREKRI